MSVNPYDREIKHHAVVDAARDLTAMVGRVHVDREGTRADTLLLLHDAIDIAYLQADWLHSYGDLTGDQYDAVEAIAKALYPLGRRALNLWNAAYWKQLQDKEEGGGGNDANDGNHLYER